MDDFDWRNPDYVAVFKARAEALKRLRAEPKSLPLVRVYYRDHPADFIRDWGITFDPRLAGDGKLALIPFIPYPRQIEWIDWVIGRWKNKENGINDKSRDMGASWLAMALACTLCIFNHGVTIGCGSRLEDLVDRIGDPDSLFWKARTFMQNLPVEFRAGWTLKDHAPHMRLIFPDTGATLTGSTGDNIGRGARSSLFFVDESAHLVRPKLVDAALSQTTNCRIDMSSVKGMNNSFAERRHDGKTPVFTLHWRDDPRKDDEWYQAQCGKYDPVLVAQEIDINYSASVEGVVIPNAWIQAAVDAHLKLGITPSGLRMGALDVADEGRDKNAYCGTHGPLIEYIAEWSGKGDDIFGTVQKAFSISDDLGIKSFRYDADGLGAGVRGDARVINERRPHGQQITIEPFRGSGAVVRPDAEDVSGRKNEDFFANCKSQGWWSLRKRFQNTYRAVTEGHKASPDEMVFISSRASAYQKLVTELSQPTYSINGVGKIVIDKSPDGTKSPNLADAVMIRFAQSGATMPITTDYLNALKVAVRR